MHITGTFPDFFNETMLPAIRAVMFQTQKTKPKLYSKLFQVESTTKTIEQFSGISGLGLFQFIGEGEPINTDDIMQLFDKTFKPKRYGLGYGVTQDMVEGDRFNFIRRMAVSLEESLWETVDIQAANSLNHAFEAGAYAGPDGVALCAANHPLPKVGGVQSNILSTPADLDVTSLELALTDWETMRKPNGIQMSLPTPRLLIAPANRWNAHEILKGTMRSDTANNTVNAFKYGEHGAVDDIIVWSKLTDPDAWFLLAPPDQTGLLWLWRRKPYTDSDFDKKTEMAYTYRRYKADVGFYDYVGVYGTPGA